MNKTGWIGLGAMGIPMATNLQKAGFDMQVYNRTADKTAALVSLGANRHSSPQEIAASSEVIFLMLTSACAVHEVLTQENGLLRGIGSGKIVIDMSTIAPRESRKFAEMIGEKGGRYIDAPVSGSVGAAVASQLVVLAGASSADAALVEKFFNVLGKKTIYFGEVGNGSAAKLVINQLLAITGQGIAEALLFAERAGLDQENVFDMITNSGMNTGMFQTKIEMFRNKNFPSAFMMELMSKDLGLISQELSTLHLDLPLTREADATYSSAKENGFSKMDMGAVYLELSRNNPK